MKIESRTLRRQHDAHMPKSPDGDIVRIKTERKGMGKLKAMLILFVALLQLGILAWLHLQLVAAFRSYLIISVILDIVTCFYVLMSNKNGRSKAVWIMLILLLFPVGFLIYFLSDENIFFRGSRKRYAKILAATPDSAEGCPGGDMSEVTAQACAYLKNVTGYIPYKNTRAKYFPSGARAFDDMLFRCSTAEKFIFIEYFTVAEGALFSRMLGVLEERAAAGVDVRIIYDDMGSSGRIPHKLKKRVRKAGIKMYAFNRLVPIYKIGMNYRDHRKITVVDGETAYTGGINVADEYVNEKRMYGYWKDNGVRVDGDAARGFTLMFLRQWEFVTRKKFDYSPFLNAGRDGAENVPSSEDICPSIEENKLSDEETARENTPEGTESEPLAGATTVAALAEAAREGAAEPLPQDEPCKPEDMLPGEGGSAEGGVFLPFAAGLEYRDPVVRDVYANVIARANKKLYIMTPYFVPDETITDLLASKARSGVDVRIVLPGVPDKKFVYLISLDNADKLTKSGVKVYTMSDAFVHTKSVLTENCAVIGSANFDLRSFFQQYENALYTDDEGVMRGLERDFENTFPECIQRRYIKHRSGIVRSLLIAILQMFAPMM